MDFNEYCINTFYFFFKYDSLIIWFLTILWMREAYELIRIEAVLSRKIISLLRCNWCISMRPITGKEYLLMIQNFSWIILLKWTVILKAWWDSLYIFSNWNDLNSVPKLCNQLLSKWNDIIGTEQAFLMYLTIRKKK